MTGRAGAATPSPRHDDILAPPTVATAQPTVAAENQASRPFAHEAPRVVAACDSEDELVAERISEAEEDWTTAAAPELRRIAPPGQRALRGSRNPLVDSLMACLAPARAPPARRRCAA